MKEARSTRGAVLLDEDNEFILDGFDFSNGVSICQELDLDDEDGMMESKIENVLSLLLPHDGVKSPSQLSDVLLKALCVSGHDASSSSSSVPDHSSSSPSAPQPGSNKNSPSDTGESASLGRK